MILARVDFLLLVTSVDLQRYRYICMPWYHMFLIDIIFFDLLGVHSDIAA